MTTDDAIAIARGCSNGTECSNSLPDGAYTLVVNHADITFADDTAMSSDQTFTFSRFYGDYTGEGKVYAADSSTLDEYFNQGLPASLWYIDPIENLGCNSTAFSDLAENFGKGAPGVTSGNILSGPFTNVVLGQGDSIAGIVSLGSTEQSFYYTNQWQMIQQDSQTSPTATPVVADQYVWGMAYVNELVLRDDNSVSGNLGKTGSGLGLRVYALQDANWNVTSLVIGSGYVAERFAYDPYGNATVYNYSNPIADQYNWVYRFQGGRWDPVTGLITFQHRDYSPVLGRWMEQDPLGMALGPNAYLGFDCNPVDEVDPLGFSTIIITIHRTDETAHSTIGTIDVRKKGDKTPGIPPGFTLEPPAAPDPDGNGSVRIPPGTYSAHWRSSKNGRKVGGKELKEIFFEDIWII